MLQNEQDADPQNPGSKEPERRVDDPLRLHRAFLDGKANGKTARSCWKSLDPLTMLPQEIRVMHLVKKARS